MISKSILKNKTIDLVASFEFLVTSCLMIFLLSIWSRSIMDIGPDTGVYLSLGKKIFEGKRYYYDFFESNFPISFYYYALQYKISLITKINPIILSEIFINVLALASLFWSAKILKRTTIYDNKICYNLIVISYFLGFFLRYPALQIAEFGTKTSLLLIFLYPYISYSFLIKKPLSKTDLIYRGLLMGIIPCIKPHYLILILGIETFYFLQNKKIRFFLRLDFLIIALCGSLGLLLMIKFDPEFIEFITWMWPQIYPSYNSKIVFIDKTIQHLGARISIFMLIFLIFSKIKLDFNDKILSIFFFSASLLMIIENAATIDQVAIFYGIITICFAKFLFRLISENKLPFSNNKFIILTLIFLPLFDITNLPGSIFATTGFINCWWVIAIIYPFYKAKKEFRKIFNSRNILLSLLYVILLITSILILEKLGNFAYIFFSLLNLFICLFVFENKNKNQPLSSFSIFVIIASSSYLFYSYITSLNFIYLHSEHSSTFSPSKLTDEMAYYNKKYAPNDVDTFLSFADLNAYRFPLLNYLNKENYGNFYTVTNVDRNFPIYDGSPLANNNPLVIFTTSYIFLDAKKQLANKKTKLIFVNNSKGIGVDEKKCSISYLERYFSDRNFRKLFFENFYFVGRIIRTRPYYHKDQINFFREKELKKFSNLQYPNEVLLQDFEVYARRNN